MTYSRLALHGLRMLLPFLDRIILRALVLFTAIFVVTLGALVGCAVAALSGARVDAVVLYGLGVIALITLAIPIVLLGLLATQRSVGLGMADELTAAAEVRPY